MADWKNSRKSTNIKDFRGNPAAADADAIGEKIQNIMDNMVLAKNTASTLPGQAARNFERKMAYDLDELGTKGKGRIGGGRGYANRLEKVTAKRQPIRLNSK
jgi:hypothetical protein